MKQSFLFVSPIFLGSLLAFFFPFQALKISFLAFYIILLLGLINISFISLNPKTLLREFNFIKIIFDICLLYLLLPSLHLIVSFSFKMDKSIQFGIMMASLSPIAVIVPQFMQNKKDKDLSIIYVILTTLLYPPMLMLYTYTFNFNQSGLQFFPLIWDSIFLTSIPLIFGLIIELFFPRTKSVLKSSISKVAPAINMVTIGVLVFIFFGSAFSKLNFSRLNIGVLIYIALNSLFQDFGTFYLMKRLKYPTCEQISFSLKNIALSGGILMLFQPMSIFACTAVFFAHGLFFMYLLWSNNLQKA